MAGQAVIVDFRMPETIQDAIRQFGVEVLPSCRMATVDEPLCGHPDIQICFAAPGCAVCTPEVFCYYASILQPYGVTVVRGGTTLDRNYPADIAYTVARAGRYAICLPKQTDAVLLEECKRAGAQVLPVRQGYAKCNICVVDGSSILTSDAGIAKTARQAGIAVLQMQPGHIALPGYAYGFIGGASGSLPDGRLFFCGDITQHPDFLKIHAFCCAKDVEYQYVPDVPLIDTGSVLPVLPV